MRNLFFLFSLLTLSSSSSGQSYLRGKDSLEIQFIENHIRGNNDTSKIYYQDSMSLSSSFERILKQRKIYCPWDKNGDSIELSKPEKAYITAQLHKMRKSVWKDSLFANSKRVSPGNSGKLITALRNSMKHGIYSPGQYLWYFSKPIFLRNNTVCLFYIQAFNGYGFNKLCFYRKENDTWKQWIYVSGGDW